MFDSQTMFLISMIVVVSNVRFTNAYTETAIELVNASYSCMINGNCQGSYQNCYAHTHLEPNLPADITPARSCRTMLQCHRDCQTRASKAETLACNQMCTDAMDSNAILLYDVLQQCFMRWCPDEHAAQECHGWATEEECESSSSCYFKEDDCSSRDTSAPEFVNCPAKDIVVNTLSTANTGIARWAHLRAIDRGISTLWKQMNGNHISGDHFPVGTTFLHFRSFDTADPNPNYADCNFSIVVNDGWPPSFTHCPKDFTVYPDSEEFFIDETGSYLHNVSWVTPTAMDYVGFSFSDDSPTVNWQAVPLGTTSVTYTAVDDALHTDTCTFSITVETPYLYYFDRVVESRPSALDYSVASVAFDLNRGFATVEQLLTQGGIIVRYFGVEVNGCAQRCFARSSANVTCQSFLMSRDGSGKCYLLSSQITDEAAQLAFDPSWDTYLARWATTAPQVEDNQAYCPGSNTAFACATNDQNLDDCAFETSFQSCSQSNLQDGCNSHLALQLQLFRGEVFSAKCDGEAFSTHPASADSSDCNQNAFAECVHCCQNRTSKERCRVTTAGISLEPDTICTSEQYTARLLCAASCFPSNDTSDGDGDVDVVTPDFTVDVELAFVATEVAMSGSADGILDKVEEAMWLIALSEALNVSTDNITVASSLNNESKTQLTVKLSVREEDILPAQPPGDDALWNYIILETVTWKTLIGEDTMLEATDIAEYVALIERRVQISSEGNVKFESVVIADVNTNVNVSDTFNTRVVTASPTAPEENFESTTTVTTTTFIQNSGITSGSANDDNGGMSSGLIAVIVIMVIFILLVALVLYLCMVYKDRKVKVHPTAPSFSAPEAIHSLPPGNGMRSPSMIRRSQILTEPDPFLNNRN